MPKHKPIKFETTLEPSLKKEVLKIVKESRQAKTILNVTLGLIAVGGILTIGAAFPALLNEIGKYKYRRKKEKFQKYQQIWKNFHNLKKQRAIEFLKEEDGHLIYRLSENGKEKIRKFVFDELSIEKPKEWDNKWRLVIFDIPETKSKTRKALRKKLTGIGFFQCQKSAWIYPFPCEEEIEFVKDFLNINPFVKLFLIDEIDDGKVLYHFKDILKI